MKIVNKKAYYNYQVIEDFVSGIILLGSEVKSIRNNNLNFGDSFVYFKDGQFEPYQTITTSLPKYDDFQRLMEEAEVMHTNQLPDATQENLPVFLN